KQLSIAGVRYFTFSSFYSLCTRCHKVDSGPRARCENCGFEHLTTLTKLGGNIVPLDMLSDARKRDLDHIIPYDFS
ncbi:hypothetical protein J2P12_06155, partial [Candidatus Bathyarchaeota archaeon]|nr:hypothetical protein [Candidatus Bathyarchaeota archaeon]